MTTRYLCHIILFFVAFVGLVVSQVPQAYAQANLPGFSVPSEDSAVPPIPMVQMDEQMFANYETAFLKLRNRMLSDTLILQYQISLLKILIRRQTEIDNISRSFEDLGVAFRQPPPDKQICERLPENLLCMLFYPELFGIDVEAYKNPAPLPAPVLEQASLPSNPAAPNGALSAVTSSPAPSAQQAMPQPEMEEEVYTPYLWTDIQCAVNSCRAVLVDSENAGRRYTVRMGDQLPDESVVQEISAQGIKVRKEDEILDVDPAPADGNFAAARRGDFDEGEIGAQGIMDALSNAGVPRTAIPRVSEDVTADNLENEGSLFDSIPAPATTDNNFTSEAAPAPENEPELLGPTGLF